ncbi:luciferase [Haloprofundus marisrubri]|uniref:Luciferase n=1 Tax=Haloprofundus marisrubri TaxID=1514971 RepID=A0A0W1R8H2_9EURY|nr:LLM class flavin-dependent oxidoreductase [Haloprofundus marisrubri]KTG09702.1 luciferase [Haloprofundus marisrubri]
MKALTDESVLSHTGIDAVALKPAECDVRRAADLTAATIAIDYEGVDHLPEKEVLKALAETADVRLTTPVRADGFDPLGDDSRVADIPESVGRVLVAGHAAYLSEDERRRAVAPRLKAARETAPEAWVGTEGIERVALAAGGTQYELLSRATERDVRALRAAGYDGELALYAPTVLTDDEDEILDAVGAYVARRRPVARALPDDCETDSRAEGRAREVLSKASRDYALVGTPEQVRERVGKLESLGVDTVVGYPARGIDEFL